MSEILAWLVKHADSTGGVGLVSTERVAEGYREAAGYSVTPLVAAPPEDGRPSYADLVEALRDFLGSDEMGMITRSHVRQHARALLSRIPREEP